MTRAQIEGDPVGEDGESSDARLGGSIRRRAGTSMQLGTHGAPACLDASVRRSP
jgi:hypothetical protein